MIHGRIHAILLSALRGLIFALLAQSAAALETVNLQLKWTHAFQFAGYYAAREKGFYRDAGLEVNIIEASPGIDPIEPVLNSTAQFGVGNSSLLLARHAGKPVVALAVIFQHSPLVLIARQDSPDQGIHDLLNKRIMIEPHSDELIAYLQREGIPLSKIKLIEHSFNPNDLISKRVDAQSAYVTNETWTLDHAGLPYQLYTPRSAGIDFYGDNLFTTEAQIRHHPKQVEAFRAASLKGWEYAMSHPEEVAELIHKTYSQQHPLAFYLYEAKRMLPLMRTDLIETGYMTNGRWRHIADTYAELGLLPNEFSLDGFLYTQDPALDLSWLLPVSTLFIFGSALVFYILLTNRRLARALESSRRTASELRSSEQRYRMLTENMADVVWAIDPQNKRFTYVSPSVNKLLGYTPEEILNLDITALLPASEKSKLPALIDLRCADLESGRIPPDNAFVVEMQQVRKNGDVLWTEVCTRYLRDEQTGQIALHGVTRDIRERKANEEHMRHLAQSDPLTGLVNRAVFANLLTQALAAARRDNTRLALLFLDLDKFKPVNDTWGHAVGDLLLQAVAQRILDCVRDSDTVARLGGDEFNILLRDVGDADSALRVAEKIRQALDQPFTVTPLSLTISASLGVALFPEHGEDALSLSKHADQAMYRAKNHGRDSVVLFDQQITSAN